MKKLIGLFTLIVLSIHASADCSSEWLSFYPSSPAIKQNSIFIVEGYANSEKIIEGLNKKFPIYLQSDNTKIKLIVLEKHAGQFNLSQAVLVPETPLEAGKEYTILIENLENERLLKRWNSHTKQFETISWKVLSEKDTVKPVWTKSPEVVKKSYTGFGCGPAVYAHINFGVKDDSAIILKTTLTNLNTQTKTTYCLEVTDHATVLIGHGMCAGAFKFVEGNEYEISFDLFDFSGNYIPWTYENLKFTAPGVNDSDY
jgi:hypothetical protein